MTTVFEPILRRDRWIVASALVLVSLLAAGLWQFSPWKYACLKHCKSPVEFLTTQRREGKSGVLQYTRLLTGLI